jgi:Undecaprenyl-phosphate galactose phosphotransferase WbaP
MQSTSRAAFRTLNRTHSKSVRVRRPVATIAALLLCDAAAIISSLLTAWLVRDTLLRSSQLPDPNTILAALVLVLCALAGASLYPAVTMNPVEELRRSTLSITLGYFALWSTTFLLRDLSESRLIYVLAYSFSLILVPLCRALIRAVLGSCSWWGCTAAILGYGSTGRTIHKSLLKSPNLGLRTIAIFDDDESQLHDVPEGVMSGALSKCGDMTREQCISYGIICMPGLSKQELLVLLDRYEHCFEHIIVIPNLVGMTSLGIAAREVGGVIGLEVTRPLLRPSALRMKRLLDIAVVLLLAAPILLLVCISAVLIWLYDRGPIFYGSYRIGRHGRPFKVWKLRSMVKDGDGRLAEYLAAHPEEEVVWQQTQKLKRDPRVTPVGRFIRKTSIDELPQFWNVFIAEMSIVGPRPVLENQVPLYGPSFALYKQVRPGITGLWQVSGRNHLSFAERVMLDKYVIQNWSVWLDLYILSRTANVVFTAEGAY